MNLEDVVGKYGEDLKLRDEGHTNIKKGLVSNRKNNVMYGVVVAMVWNNRL